MRGRKWTAIAVLIGLLAGGNCAAAQGQPQEFPPLAGGETVEVQPGANDLTREQADAVARQMIADNEEVSEEALEDCRTESLLYAFPEERQRTFWSVLFYPLDEPPGGDPLYCAELDGRTGEAIQCFAWREQENPSAALAWLRRERGLELIWGQRVGDANNPGWTMAQQASFDAWATEIGVYPDGVGACVQPAAEDLSLEQALALAEQALIEQHGWEAGRIGQYAVFASLKKAQQGRVWTLRLSPKAGAPEEAEGGCWIYIGSPSGEVYEIRADWDGNG